MDEFNHASASLNKIPTHSYNEEKTVLIDKLGNSFRINDYTPDSDHHYTGGRDTELGHHPCLCIRNISRTPDPLIDEIIWLKLYIEQCLEDYKSNQNQLRLDTDTHEYALYIINKLFDLVIKGEDKNE